MTDPTPRPDDELVSAVLDGEATADERALVEADPASRQRLSELRAARDLVAAPIAVPAAARESAIAAALAEFDAGRPAATDLVASRPRTGAAPTDPTDPAGTAATTAPDQLAARRA